MSHEHDRALPILTHRRQMRDEPIHSLIEHTPRQMLLIIRKADRFEPHALIQIIVKRFLRRGYLAIARSGELGGDVALGGVEEIEHRLRVDYLAETELD